MTLGRSPQGGLLRHGDGIAKDCCCDVCCCPGLTTDTPYQIGARLLWSVTSTCGLEGDLDQDYSLADPCVGGAGTFTSVSLSLGTCDGSSPIPVRFTLTCTGAEGPLCERYRLTATWGQSGCFNAQRGPWAPEAGCDCDPFYLVFKIPCPYGIVASCRCSTGTITVTVTRTN